MNSEDGMTLEDLSVDQLRQLKKDRYQAASDQGILRNLRIVAQADGVDPASIDSPDHVSRFMQKYLVRRHDPQVGRIDLYMDDYGGYLTVKVDGREVCSTHRTDQFFVPGRWVDVLLDHVDECERVLQRRSEDAEHHARQRLIDQMRPL